MFRIGEWTSIHKLNQMASLITLTSVAPSDSDFVKFTSPCTAFSVNVANIQSVEDYVNTDFPGAHSKVNLKYTQANHFKSQTVYVNEARATIVTDSNA